MKTEIIAALALAAIPAFADLREAKELMKQNQPGKAGEVLNRMQTQQPGDPWLVYNEGVAAYAAKDFPKADKIWQELAAKPLPHKLRDQVWTQIGNVAYRLGEPLETSAPEQAVTHWQQSRESYRVVLAAQPKNTVVSNNLAVVEAKLAKVHARLAQRLVQETQKERSNQKAIEKLEAALDHQRTAQNLLPKDEEIKQEQTKIEQALAERYTKKAAQAEKRADELAASPNQNSWQQKEAEKQLNAALTDFAQAKSLDEKNQEAKDGEKRVQDKLAKLLAQQGERLHDEANKEAERSPEEAIAKMEQALDKFDESLNLKADQPETKQEQAETKKDLENLLEKRGDQLAQQGEQNAQRRPAEAAEQKMAALAHYQEAQQLNPDNAGLQPKIDALEKGLPELLNALGEREQQRAAQAEPKSTEQAVGHLERAQTAYQLAQEIAPENQQAQQGAEQVQSKLAQLREQLAQQMAQQQNQNQKSQQDKPGPSFQQMLAKVKSDEKQKQYEQSRRNPTEKYTPEQNRIFKNW
jgi:hypothetical protein